MVRKTETPPPGMDDNAVAVLDESPAEHPMNALRENLAAEYPQVGWRESELPFLFLAHGVADGGDLAAIEKMGLDHREIRKRTERIKHIHELAKRAGTRGSLAAAEAEEAATRQRIADQRREENDRHAAEVERHRQRLEELTNEERAIGNEVGRMRSAQETLHRLVPDVIVAQRGMVRDGGDDADLKEDLRDAMQKRQLLRMVEADSLVVPGLELPEGLFTQGSLLYIGMEKLPVRLPRIEHPATQVRHADGSYTEVPERIEDPNITRIASRWTAKKAELAAMLPAVEAEVAALEHAIADARAQREAQASKLSYVRD